MADKIKPKKVACFMPAYAFGNALAAGFEAVIKKYPEITLQDLLASIWELRIFRRDLEAVRDFMPDVIVIGSWGQDAVNAFNQAFEMGLGKSSKLFHLWTVNADGHGDSSRGDERRVGSNVLVLLTCPDSGMTLL